MHQPNPGSPGATATRWVDDYRARHRPGSAWSRILLLVAGLALLAGPARDAAPLLSMAVLSGTAVAAVARRSRDAALVRVVDELTLLPAPDRDAHRRHVGKLLDVCHPAFTSSTLRDEAQVRGLLQAAARQMAVRVDRDGCRAGHADWCRHRADREAWQHWWIAPHTRRPLPLAAAPHRVR